MKKRILTIMCITVSVLTLFFGGCQSTDISGDNSTSSKNETSENIISDNHADAKDSENDSQFHFVSEKISLPKIRNYKNNIRFEDAQNNSNLINKIPSALLNSITNATIYYDDFSEIMTTLKKIDQDENIQKEIYILFQEASDPTTSLYRADDTASFVTAYIRWILF